MSPHPVTVHPETDLAEAVELLTSTTVKSVPVVDRQGYLKGVLSRSDIVRLLARADAEIQREVDELLRSTGLKDWLVDVQDGAVQLLGPEDSDDTLVARLLAAHCSGRPRRVCSHRARVGAPPSQWHEEAGRHILDLFKKRP